MQLDKRFKVLPFCCFGAEKCEKYIGQKGYFAKRISYFSDINSCKYGTLEKIDSDQEPFYLNETEQYFSFFIPECFVKPKEKQYRAFTMNEFLHVYELGDIVTFKCKYNNQRFAGMVTGYETDKDGNNGMVHVGCYSYTLSALFADFERINSEEGEWVPFGIEIEE